MLAAKISGTGELDNWRRIKRRIGQRTSDLGRLEQCFHSETAARLKMRLVILPAPTGAAGETPGIIFPFALREVEFLVAPFRGRDQIAHFIILPLQPIAPQGRLDPRVFGLGEVAAKFHLEGWRAGREGELL